MLQTFLNGIQKKQKEFMGKQFESRFEDTRVHVYYQPVGVVAGLSPWNFPLILSARKFQLHLQLGVPLLLNLMLLHLAL